MNNPRISIITPSFNRADVVEETARSIFSQTYGNWEWVIVDDGSTDNSWEVLESFAAQDSRVKIYKRDREPKGACTCRNIAVEKSTGEYLLFLDTDDLLAPYCLQQRLSAMEENPGCDFIIFPMLMFEKHPDDLNILWNVDKDEDDLQRILVGDPVCQGTGPLWKKKSFIDIGMWNEHLKLWQDIELHIRSLLHPVVYKKKLDFKPDVYLRVSDNSLSRGGFHSAPKMKSRISVFTYACDEIHKKGLQDKYKSGLRVMGLDIIMSSINSRLYKEAENLLNMAKRYNIFNDSEIKKFRFYMNAFRLKVYKLQSLFAVIRNRVHAIAISPETTMTKIKWNNNINK